MAFHENWRVDGYRQVVELLRAKAELQPGVDIERATDLLLLVAGVDVYRPRPRPRLIARGVGRLGSLDGRRSGVRTPFRGSQQVRAMDRGIRARRYPSFATLAANVEALPTSRRP
jgi:hypothetical protein